MKRKPTLRAALLPCVVAVPFTCLLASCAHGDDARMTKAFGGRDVIDQIRAATKVEIFRVAGFRQLSAQLLAGPTVAGFPILAGPVLLEPSAAKRLAATVTDPHTYQFEMADACMFDPGYAARFTTGQHVTELAFCFNCNDVLVANHGYLSMMPGHQALLAQLAPLFPSTTTAPASPAR